MVRELAWFNWINKEAKDELLQNAIRTYAKAHEHLISHITSK